MANLIWPLVCFIFLLMVPTANCVESDTLVSSISEFSFVGGYGITHRGYGATKTQIQTFDMSIRYGHFLSDEVGKGRWYQGRHEIFLELPFHLALDHDCRTMIGGTILGRGAFPVFVTLTP